MLRLFAKIFGRMCHLLEKVGPGEEILVLAYHPKN